ncbi:MAG: M20/M25/M40 family metallo-hydrolase [Candidatus Latescibacteria bacterium]|nr:M20/M25/M40 family metallo-hydrolase [Candidatus Latescibacterota bacterium]
MNPDFAAAGAEAVTRLQQMLRFDTTNPPGNELPLAQHLATQVARDGLEARILEAAPGRANLVVRLRGDGSQRPLLLISHLDVVPAEPARWTHPPFAGKVAEGQVWGRGAVDSKLTTTAQLQVLLLCKRLGLPLKRDLVLVATADEELGSNLGVKWLAQHHPEVFDAEYGINEGGGFALLVDGRPLYTCQVGEKGSANLDLVIHGRPGHSSVPHADNPLLHLSTILERLSGRLPHRVTASARAFFEGAAAAQARPEVAALLRALLDPARQASALAQLPVDEPTRLMFDAMLRNTCAPTMLEAGVKRNVIPSEATVKLSGRTLPNMDQDTFLAEVRSLVGEGPEFRLDNYWAGAEFASDTPLLAAIQSAMQHCEPGSAVVPYMVTGGTDARFLQGRDLTVYGFLPMRHEPGMDFFSLCHGHDERVSTANVAFAVRVLYEVVRQLNE